MVEIKKSAWVEEHWTGWYIRHCDLLLHVLIQLWVHWHLPWLVPRHVGQEPVGKCSHFPSLGGIVLSHVLHDAQRSPAGLSHITNSVTHPVSLLISLTLSWFHACWGHLAKKQSAPSPLWCLVGGNSNGVIRSRMAWWESDVGALTHITGSSQDAKVYRGRFSREREE